jgi:hypothetical protein
VSVRVSARPNDGIGKLAYLASRAGRKLSAATGSQIALEFTFLDGPLMRLIGALDAILTIIAFDGSSCVIRRRLPPHGQLPIQTVEVSQQSLAG